MKTAPRMMCLAMVALLSCGSFARAQSLVHVDELAVTAERQARQVFFQAQSLHAYGPAAQELKDNSQRMIRLASHIHEVAHVDRHGDHRHGGQGRQFGLPNDRQTHINRDVGELDRLMHEMQGMVARMRFRTEVRVPAYGGRHGVGQVAVSVGRGFSINVNTRGPVHVGQSAGYRATSTLNQIENSLAELSVTVHRLLHDTQVVCIRKR